MKKTVFLLLVILSAASVNAQISRAKLQASGLTCAMCSKAVFKALSAVPSVEKVTPDIEGSSYEIQFKSTAEPVLDDLSKAVTDAGFSVARLDVTARFDGAKLEDNAHIRLANQTFHFVTAPAQALSGERTFRVVDRQFVPEKDARKYEKLTTLKCYASGMMDGKRVYHITL